MTVRDALCVVGALGLWACRDGAPISPVQPTSTAATVAGVWSGPATDSTGPGQLTWTVAQEGDVFSGTVVMVDGGTGLEAAGTVSGTVIGPAVRFAMRVPAGAFGRPLQLCETNVEGGGTLAGTTLAATYSGSNTCTGRIETGVITMNRR